MRPSRGFHYPSVFFPMNGPETWRWVAFQPSCFSFSSQTLRSSFIFDLALCRRFLWGGFFGGGSRFLLDWLFFCLRLLLFWRFLFLWRLFLLDSGFKRLLLSGFHCGFWLLLRGFFLSFDYH